MTLTVRLDAALQAALEVHCAERGVTKSLVVQECLAQYLVQAADGASGTKTRQGRGRGGLEAAAPSKIWRAFSQAGLIGSVSAGPQAADKAAVRQRMAERLKPQRAA